MGKMTEIVGEVYLRVKEIGTDLDSLTETGANKSAKNRGVCHGNFCSD